MKAEELKKIAKRYAQDELKDNHSAVEDVVAAAFLNGIDYAEHHPHWISVEDELPQEGENVLVSINGSVFYGCWLGGEIWAIARQPLEEKINGEVTHWMPLPPVVSKTENAKQKGGEQ